MEWKFPTHVVIDRRDGYVFKNDSTGQLFNGERARAFAEHRNSGCKPGHATYAVYSLRYDPTPSYDDSEME